MRKGLTEIVFILDRSGSMSGLESDTIGGYNAMLAKQKKEDGEAYVSTVLFDDRIDVLHDRKVLADVEPITEKDYYVRGCTALLDAVGGAIHHIGNVHKYAREEDVPEKTLFIITTDGYENASRRYTYEKVRQMIERQKERYNWEFIFLGANMDAVKVAERFGVASNRAVTYESDNVGTELNYTIMSDLVSKARASRSAKDMSAAFEDDTELEAVREDYREYTMFSAMASEKPDYDEVSMEQLRGRFHELSKREQDVMACLYGMNGQSRHTYAEAERLTGMSKGRIRQAEHKALRKVKKS